jgi:hypothetical protein
MCGGEVDGGTGPDCTVCLGDENVPKLMVDGCTTLWAYKPRLIVHFKELNDEECKLYPNKTFLNSLSYAHNGSILHKSSFQ